MMSGAPHADIHAVAARFDFGAPVAAIAPHGRGLINDTYRVELGAAPPRAAILQRINTRVFTQPEQIMANLRALDAHVRRATAPRALIVPFVYPARDGKAWVVDAHGAFWRALQFVPDARTLPALASEHQARSLGAALGAFHTLVHDIPANALHITLPGFHVTPGYLARYDAVSAHIASADETACAEFIETRRAFAHCLERARERGALRLRPTHGDPKLDNFLFDAHDNAISLIDLDTVQPGLIHYDLGDCTRSACNRGGESPADPAAARFDADVCIAILRGYVAAARDMLTGADFDYFYDALRLIPFELGLRFFADHLAGDVYFKTQYRGHNLLRARVQFALTADIERQDATLRRAIDALR